MRIVDSVASEKTWVEKFNHLRIESRPERGRAEIPNKALSLKKMFIN